MVVVVTNFDVFVVSKVHFCCFVGPPSSVFLLFLGFILLLSLSSMFLLFQVFTFVVAVVRAH